MSIGLTYTLSEGIPALTCVPSIMAFIIHVLVYHVCVSSCQVCACCGWEYVKIVGVSGLPIILGICGDHLNHYLITTYISTAILLVVLISVGLTQARPNYPRNDTYTLQCDMFTHTRSWKPFLSSDNTSRGKI